MQKKTRVKAMIAALNCTCAVLPVLAGSLSVGSDAPECNSMLHPGSMVRCVSAEEIKSQRPEPLVPTVLPPKPIPSSKKDEPLNSWSGVTEKDIDDYLASYGKPPRAAVRAILNPTDANIAQMGSEEKRMQVIASYVAQRWTEMQQSKSIASAAPTLDAYTMVPAFVGMRVTVVATAECKSCEAIVASVQQLLEEAPVVNARLMMITDDDTMPIETLVKWGSALPANIISFAQARRKGWTEVPTVEITDMKSKKQRTLSGEIDLNRLKGTIMNMRKQSITLGEPAK